MRRWIWRILLTAAVMAALTVGVSAADTIVTEDGIRYNLTTGTVLGPVSKDNVVSITIRASVNGSTINSIAPDAFNGCGKLTTVNMESGIKTVGASAFNSCTLLQSILLPDSIDQIGDYAFANCGRLNNVVLPTILKDIKTGTFANCSSLKAIYIATVDHIYPSAFAGSGVEFLHRDTAAGLKQDDTPELPIHVTTRVPGLKTEPTCILEGRQAYSYNCTEGCGAKFNFSQSRPIPPLGHTPDTKKEPAIDSTCVTPGRTEGYLCTVCGQVASGMEETPLDPTNHEKPETMEDVPPTCTEAGSTGGEICRACGVEITAPTPVDALEHEYTGKLTDPISVKDPTCTETGLSVQYKICDRCGETEVCEQCEELKADPEKETEYLAHIKDTHTFTEPAAKGHTPGGDQYVVTLEPTCTTEGKEEWVVVCTVCGKPTGDVGVSTPPNNEYERVIPATGHTPEKNEIDKDRSKAATCTEDGLTVYKPTKCRVCKEDIDERQEKIDALGHDLTAPVDVPKGDATCLVEGIVWKNFRECRREGCDYEEYEEVRSKGPHTWTNPQPDPALSDQDVDPKCGEPGVKHVIVTCSVCGKTEKQTIEIPATGTHEYGEWTTTKEPTATEEGEESRTCTICGKVDTRPISPTGSPEDPDDPDKPTTPPEDADFSITLIPPANGTASVSKTTAKKGETITVTYTANSGYVLDMIRVIGGSELVSYTDLGNGQIRFTMPAANVEVRVTFDRQDANYGESWGNGFGSEGGNRSDPRRTTDVVPVQKEGYSVPKADAHEQVFQDVSTGHWAAGEINWAYEMGYMSGTNGRFNPDGAISHQQMWMVLARLTGGNPASMAEARSWAVRGGYADGSAPTAAVKRHQLVTALYRCARLTGAVSKNNTSLAGYTDSTAVPVRAREAFSWALTSGVITGDAGGRLNPAKNLTRAEFAVILYCYSQRH